MLTRLLGTVLDARDLGIMITMMANIGYQALG